MVRKKRKLKRKVKILIFLLPIIILSLLAYKKINLNQSKPQKKSNDKEIINNILSHNINNIDESFLKWISNNYKDSIPKIDNYLKDNEYNENIWHKITGNSLIVLQDLYNNKYDNMTNITIKKENNKEITINFIGDVSLADNWYIAPKYDERNKKILGILSEEVVDELTKSTLSVANSEFTVSNRGEKMPNKYYTFRAKPERLPIYNEMGIDLVTLANNHVYDFGEYAFLDMLESFDNYKIPHIGAGKNISEASTPYYFITNGYKISFINANRSEKNILTPEATDTEPGVLRCYDPTLFTELITKTKKESDFLIALIHWGKEDSHELEQVQIDTSKTYIDAGADLIVGTHAHVLQGIDFYKDKAIIYNLGDFIFNDEDKDTMIYKLLIDNEGNFKHYIIPAHQKDEYTFLLKDNEKNKVINNIINYSENKIKIDSNGEIIKN
ncbi:MAG: CapA family protein [Bacilli bacterium]|nr:CapA family protein [Bacilli bacterium]